MLSLSHVASTLDMCLRFASLFSSWASLVAPCGNEPACQCRRCGFNPWVGKIPWRRKWQPSPEFLAGKSHGQKELAGYSPWSHKESAMTEHARMLSSYCPSLSWFRQLLLISPAFLYFYFFLYFCAGSLLLSGFPLVVVTSCFSLVVVCGLLIEVVSCCGAWTIGHMGFSSWSTWALEHRLDNCGLSCSAAYGIFPDQGSSPCLLHRQAGSLPLSHRGSPHLAS